MLKYITFIAVIIFSTILRTAEVQLADSHGPISIMGDHSHKKGEMMFSYRFGHMQMNKIMNGTKVLYSDNITSAPNGASNGSGNYMNASVSMKMDIHMFGVMYAPHDLLTLMLMTSYLEKEMIQRRMPMAGGSLFNVNSSGMGDTRLSGILNVFEEDYLKTFFGLGISIPTGSINIRDNTSTSSGSKLGYSMQNGSGTFDPFIFINNVNNLGRLKVGERFFFKKSVYKNTQNYKQGDLFKATLWTSYRWVNFISSSFGLNYEVRKKMSGSDNEMNPRMSPAMDSRNQGYQKLFLSFGLNFVNPNIFLKNHRIGIEGIFPTYQRYRGLQMSERYKVIVGWQYSF